jgi:hypothetical protein
MLWVVANPCLEHHGAEHEMATPGDWVRRYPGFGAAYLRRSLVGTRAAYYRQA